MEKAKLSRSFLGSADLLLKAGMTPQLPHQHPGEELMVVTQGTVRLPWGRESAKVEPGLHGIVNTGLLTSATESSPCTGDWDNRRVIAYNRLAENGRCGCS
jgi:hypothetical protein